MMKSIPGLLLMVQMICLAAMAPVWAQDGENEIPDSVDQVYVDGIDPYSVSPGEYMAFDYEAYAKQGQLAYQAGDYEQAARYYLALIMRNVDDSGTLYNLACCYGQLEVPVMAALFLEGAFAAGYEDYGWASWDPDFEAVRDDPAFQESWERITEQVEEERGGLGIGLLIAAQSLLKCQVRLPEYYDPEQAYPLLIGLHGYGDNADNFGGLLDRREIGNAGFIYASPQAPYPFLPGKKIGYSWIEGAQDDDETWPIALAMSEEYVCAVVAELKARYSISDVYLMGFSQGCVMTYDVGLTYPELFDGLVCFAGWLETELFTDEQLAAASHLPVFIGQGLEDKMVEPEESYNARDTLVEHGFTVELHEFDGGHAVPEDALRAALIYLGLLE